jgi:hypothetical protein
MVNVYSEEQTPRSEYIFRILFESILGSKVDFYYEENGFSQSEGLKINYSHKDIANALTIKPHTLLFEKHIQQQNPEVTVWESLPIFFSISDSFLPFDIFAASFFLVTRYEEYLPGKRDRHQRFLSRNSLASQHRFLEKPLINCWAWKMAEKIEEASKTKLFEKSKFSYIPTFDIDNAWAYKNKGFFRNLGAALKDLIRGKFKDLGERFSVLTSLKKDPFDNYSEIQDIMHGFGFRPTFFMLIKKQGKHDRSLSFKNSAFRKLIKSLSEWGEVGIHPSYTSWNSKKALQKEIVRLEEILGKKVKSSRQHYLRISMPKTYRRLLSSGIETDYSLGYASRPGFRASICTPFLFFDLLKNEQTSLKIVPFQVMDATLLEYRNYTPGEALNKIKSLIKETADVGGTFVSLWHNESLGDKGKWNGWGYVYNEMSKLAFELQK